jgi:hypothetical protein
MKGQHSEDKKARTKKRELEVYLALTEAGIHFDYQVYLPFRDCGLETDSRCAYADFVIYYEWGVAILEVDEDSHGDKDPSCDPRRDMDMVASVTLGSDQSQKVVIIHFNPDTYKVSGTVLKIPMKERLATLVQLLKTVKTPEVLCKRVYMYYEKENSTATLPLIASKWNSDELLQITSTVP